jgi:hypothetical protein
MSDSTTGVSNTRIAKEGPKAPKDPTARRSGFYIMYENMVEASATPDGKFCHPIFLEGRVVDKAKFTGGVTDENILELLTNCEGISKLVHSIGITVTAKSADLTSVGFAYHNLGKTNRFESGTRIELTCPADGSETLLVLDDYEWSADDDVPGSFTFFFDQVGQLASVSVMFYLNDGYHVPEVSLEAAVDYESNAYEEMIKKSLLNVGNNNRLKRAIEKAKRGEDVTIACIGGSITQGAGAVPIQENCYANQFYNKFKQQFGKDGGKSISFIKAGVGGTPSELGIVRYDRDVLRNKSVEPDIVVIEFAVNDAGDETEGNCFESLALKALQEPNQPAVILLFSVFVNDWNLQDRLAPVGWHYNLPMVSIKDAVVDQFKLSKSDGNVVSKRQFFYDIYHPTNDGHLVMADSLLWLIQTVDAAVMDEEDIELNKAPIIGNDFAETKLLDRSNAGELVIVEPGGFTDIDTDLQMVEMDNDPHRSPQFPHNWMHNPEQGAPEFKLTITSKRLLLVFKDSGSNEFGSADIYVDGNHLKKADPHENNWTHCNAVILYNEEVATEHTIVIKMAEGDEQKLFTILGFGYC